jgi:hypothetical protein
MKDSKPLHLLPPPPQPQPTKPKRSTLKDVKAKASRSKRKTAPAPITFDEAGALLGRPVAFHPIHAEIAGSVEAGVFLGQALYWTRIQDETNPTADGWFWKTQDEWFHETRIKRDGQETSRKQLIRRGILIEERRPLPPPSFQPRIFYKINRDNYLLALWQAAKNQNGAMHPTRKMQRTRQERGIAPDKKGALPPSFSTEITSQTTADTTSSRRVDDFDLQSLIDNLVAAGVTPGRARKLAPQHHSELTRRLEFLPHLANVENAGALLCARLDEPWTEPSALTKKLQAELLEAHLAAQQRAAQQRATQSAADRQRAERENDELDLWFKQLPATDRAEIDDQARRRVAPLVAIGANVDAALKAARRNIIRKELNMPTEEDEEESP